ncbi:phospholipid-transporting ATPase [Nematocida major]|uniref:phospholipid-transporting ATPase n=1 Tax=Nematocida major TaxID=1912982 RepID=UPI0020088671|nr:phospholipid-transporting ATPase [Nematocida major]KAH9387019.1 phospholipid-transporting ATPase [Nematocida major]
MFSVCTPKHFARACNAVSTTSHSLAGFLPARLFREATKSFNVFFLALCAVVSLQNLTSFSRSWYIVCVLFTIAVSILKTAVQELRKFSLDQAVNKQQVLALRNRKFAKISREDINPGDRILLQGGNPFPVDLFLLGAYAEGLEKGFREVYIETSAINGESALKVKKPILKIGKNGKLLQDEIDKIEEIICEYSEIYAGNLRILSSGHAQEKTYPCSDENFAPAGASLFSQCTVLGLALPTKKSPPLKTRIKESLFMAEVARLVTYVLAAYAALLLASSVASGYFIGKSEWLLGPANTSFLGHGLRAITANILIFSSLVPLSLFVTLDGLRIAYSTFIHTDPGMKDPENSPKCNSHGVIEDIALVSHVLSDKTGTLTMNKMHFVGVHFPLEMSPCFFEEPLENFRFSGPEDADFSGLQDSFFSGEAPFLAALTILLCHSVDVVDGKYIGISQEEVCMLERLKSAGFLLEGRTETEVTLSVRGRPRKFLVLGKIPFSAAVSRMSVIVMGLGRVLLLTKGSNEVVTCEGAPEVSGEFRSLAMAAHDISEKDVLDYLQKSFHSGECPECGLSREEVENSGSNGCSCEGLHELIQILRENPKRSPVISSFSDPEEEAFSAWNSLQLPVSFLLHCEEASSYAGTLYIRDQLQPHAQKTVEEVASQGVKLWMLTGDRKESAISCGISSGMQYNPYKVFAGREIVQILLENPKLAKESSVIVYRCSPEEKAEIAHSLRKMGEIVLAIGDGENDIEMIKEADVGICVCGVESSKPALSSDLVVPSFKSLGRLVAFHGPNAFGRLKSVFLFFVFKSICVSVCQCTYGAIVGASGSMAPSSIFLLFFNSLLTSPLSIEMGIFRRKCLKPSVFDAFLQGVLYGAASFAVVYSIFGRIDVLGGSGDLAGHKIVSCFFSLCLFISTLCYFFYSAESFVWCSFCAVAASVLFFVLSLGLESEFSVFFMPEFYVCAVYMAVTAMLVERTCCLVRRKDQRRLLEALEAADHRSTAQNLLDLTGDFP